MKTADGVEITHGMTVYLPDRKIRCEQVRIVDDYIVSAHEASEFAEGVVDPSRCYSTAEAAARAWAEANGTALIRDKLAGDLRHAVAGWMQTQCCREHLFRFITRINTGVDLPAGMSQADVGVMLDELINRMVSKIEAMEI